MWRESSIARMLNATRDLVLPTTITGSYPRPHWFTEELRGRGFKDALGDSRFREQYLDAVSTLVREQEMAGLDIVTDGDSRFDLTVGGTVLPMRRREDQWWTADRRMQDGELYGYIVDGEGPFPDPRSMFQPLGVHELSACVDHTGFEWTDDAWQPPPLAAGVIYELHIGTFSEAGVTQRA